MKIGSINICLLSCQFYYTYETKKLCITTFISLFNLMKNISKYHFSGEEVLLISIIDIYCSAPEGGADQNWLAVEVVKTFHFAKVSSEWLLNGRIIQTRVQISSFWFKHCMYQTYLRLISDRFWIHLLLFVYKLYSFLFLFWI